MWSRRDISARCPALRKSRPPSRPDALANSREPIALHWPVMLFAPVPGRPRCPAIRARLMTACAVRVALIDAHRPPETHGLARADGFGEAEKLSDGETRFRRDLVRRELRDELGELGEARRVAFDEFAVGPAFLREQIRDAVEHSQIGLRAQR